MESQNGIELLHNNNKNYKSVDHCLQKSEELFSDIRVFYPAKILTKYKYKGRLKTQNLFIKSCVFILTGLNFSHLQSTLHLMQYNYRYVLSTAQSSF